MVRLREFAYVNEGAGPVEMFSNRNEKTGRTRHPLDSSYGAKSNKTRNAGDRYSELQRNQKNRNYSPKKPEPIEREGTVPAPDAFDGKMLDPRGL